MESMANHLCPNRAQRSLSKYCHFVPIKRCLKVLWTKDTKKLEMHSFHENKPYITQHSHHGYKKVPLEAMHCGMDKLSSFDMHNVLLSINYILNKVVILMSLLEVTM